MSGVAGMAGRGGLKNDKEPLCAFYRLNSWPKLYVTHPNLFFENRLRRLAQLGTGCTVAVVMIGNSTSHATAFIFCNSQSGLQSLVPLGRIGINADGTDVGAIKRMLRRNFLTRGVFELTQKVLPLWTS
jgi:hypothetical protein